MKRISASRVGAMLGMDKRLSPLGLFLMLTGQMPDPYDDRDQEGAFDDEAIEAGKMFESAIRDLACKKYSLERIDGPKSLEHPEIPLVGHPDAYVVHEGKVAVLEIKLVFFSGGEEWGPPLTDEVPLPYYMQALAYGILFRDAKRPECFEPKYPVADYVLLAAWFAGQGLKLYKIPIPADLERKLRDEVAAFLHRVETDNPPDAQTEADLRMRWLADPKKSVHLGEEDLGYLAVLKDLRDQERSLKRQKEQAQMYLLQRAQDASKLLYQRDGVTYTVASVSANRVFDADGFLQDQPNLAADYQTLDTARLRKEQKAAYEAYMRLPESITEQTRVLRILKDFDKLIDQT